MERNIKGLLLSALCIMSINEMVLNGSVSMYNNDSLEELEEGYDSDSYDNGALDMLDRAVETDEIKQEIRASLENEQSIQILEKLNFAGLHDYKRLRYLICVMHQRPLTQDQIKIKLSIVLRYLANFNKGLDRVKEDNFFDSSSDEFAMIDQLAESYNIEEGSVEQSMLAFKLAMFELPYILKGSYC